MDEEVGRTSDANANAGAAGIQIEKSNRLAAPGSRAATIDELPGRCDGWPIRHNADEVGRHAVSATRIRPTGCGEGKTGRATRQYLCGRAESSEDIGGRAYVESDRAKGRVPGDVLREHEVDDGGTRDESAGQRILGAGEAGRWDDGGRVTIGCGAAEVRNETGASVCEED